MSCCTRRLRVQIARKVVCWVRLTTAGLIFYQGVNAHPSSKRNDSRIDSKNHKNPKNMARRSMYFEERSSVSQNNKEDKNDSLKDKSLESVVLAIDTGVKTYIASKTKPDVVDSIAKTLFDFARKTASNPVYRSKGKQYDIRPELIRFKDDKPSVLLEINSESIINGLKDLLRSKALHNLMDHFSKEAAVVYRSIKYELEKDKNKKDGQQ